MLWSALQCSWLLVCSWKALETLLDCLGVLFSVPVFSRGLWDDCLGSSPQHTYESLLSSVQLQKAIVAAVAARLRQRACSYQGPEAGKCYMSCS